MKPNKLLPAAIAALLPVVACQSLPGAAPPAIDAVRIAAIVQELASDEYEGRAPGSAGEAKTVAFLEASFRALGLEPGGENGAWTQAVPLVRTQLGTPRALALSVRGQSHALTQGSEIYLNTVRNADRILVRDAPLVFVGYGVTAPERE